MSNNLYKLVNSLRRPSNKTRILLFWGAISTLLLVSSDMMKVWMLISKENQDYAEEADASWHQFCINRIEDQYHLADRELQIANEYEGLIILSDSKRRKGELIDYTMKAVSRAMLQLDDSSTASAADMDDVRECLERLAFDNDEDDGNACYTISDIRLHLHREKGEKTHYHSGEIAKLRIVQGNHIINRILWHLGAAMCFGFGIFSIFMKDVQISKSENDSIT